MRGAVIILSGGMDSATTLAIAIKSGFQVRALTISYGQRNKLEILRAQEIAKMLGVAEHILLGLDLSLFGGSSLTSESIIPKGDDLDKYKGKVPPTYVPARNTVFLSCALAFAESRGVKDIFIGANAIDYSGYPDCRPEFLRSFEATANLGTKIGVDSEDAIKVHAPLIKMKKSEIVQKGIELGVDFSMTLSCYDPNQHGEACGECDSCRLRLKAFADLGLSDPATYVREKKCTE